MRCGILFTAVLAAGALAATPGPALAATRPCGASRSVMSQQARLADASYKAAHDTLHLGVPVAPAAPACAAIASGQVVLGNLNQQGQITDYYCGPATVSEMAATRGLRVDQSTAGGWMGTDPDTGTDVGQLVRALNHFVGDPGGGWYLFVPLSYSPTAGEQAAFASRLRWDVTTYGGWPVAGDAWEVPGGPHLVGHPDVEIFHWIEIGGLGEGDGAVYYADSATTVWSGVPAYSWIDLESMVTILGGRGYAW